MEYKDSGRYIDLLGLYNSGQCFRVFRDANNEYEILSRNKYSKFRIGDNGTLEYTCSDEVFNAYWNNYFDFGTEYPTKGELLVECARRDDLFLMNAIGEIPEIRILRQDIFEVLISFIISQRKSIHAIRQCVGILCRFFGAPFPAEYKDRQFKTVRAFPAPPRLESLSRDSIRRCGVGYRDEYIKEAVDWWLFRGGERKMARLYGKNDEDSYNEAMTELMKVKGIGKKVANCVCLYGLHMFRAVPEDVWIKRVIDEDYGGEKPEWMEGEYAGLLQQYAFEYKRRNGFYTRPIPFEPVENVNRGRVTEWNF